VHFAPQGAVLDLSRVIRNRTVRNPFFSATSRYVPRDEEPPPYRAEEDAAKRNVQTRRRRRRRKRRRRRRKVADNDNDVRRERSQFSNGPEKVVGYTIY